jgi:hypothetical protein
MSVEVSQGWLSWENKASGGLMQRKVEGILCVPHTSYLVASLWIALSRADTSASNKAQGTLGDCHRVPVDVLRGLILPAGLEHLPLQRLPRKIVSLCIAQDNQVQLGKPATNYSFSRSNVNPDPGPREAS